MPPGGLDCCRSLGRPFDGSMNYDAANEPFRWGSSGRLCARAPPLPATRLSAPTTGGAAAPGSGHNTQALPPRPQLLVVSNLMGWPADRNYVRETSALLRGPAAASRRPSFFSSNGESPPQPRLANKGGPSCPPGELGPQGPPGGTPPPASPSCCGSAP